ncbi:uncharacterized protein N7496_004089 [Penicillium cataractarum]|uniref:Uncharacterized protein n=1 Tax=Penicillium cataractarum TaxID=2100454 RepID=A0A9W9SNB8_9EURO|nr:uncharacterized protein N7496_004089 [Penicillium cataractarum]KAJ5381661.1 hypothetical protein N7496_004089 [Penicillium cataractarum]
MFYNNASMTNLLGSTMPYFPEPIISPLPGPQTIDEYVDDDYVLVSPVQPPCSATPTIYSDIGTTLADAAGWWSCHNCGNMNNPDLAPERCSNCPHYKCADCSNNVPPPVV